MLRFARRPASASAQLLKGLQPATVRSYQRAYAAFYAHARRENWKQVQDSTYLEDLPRVEDGARTDLLRAAEAV